MSRKDNGLASLFLVVGTVLLVAVDSPSLLILILVKLVGLSLMVSGSYMICYLNDGENEND